ncbi:hypothetical protein H8959_007621 [Pygathrix nigripes]
MPAEQVLGGEALHLIFLPAVGNVAENSPPGTSVHKFSVKLSASLSPVIPRLPQIINSNPLTEAFRVIRLSGTYFEVVTTGKEQLDFETGPNVFDLQIYVKDEVGVTDLQVLTFQVTDVNEPPQFQGDSAEVDFISNSIPWLKGHILTFAFFVTGAIQVAQMIDRDAGELRQNPTISLEVLVKDRPYGGQENHVQITFIVEDISDNPATCQRFTLRLALKAEEKSVTGLTAFITEDNLTKAQVPSLGSSSGRTSQPPYERQDVRKGNERDASSAVPSVEVFSLKPSPASQGCIRVDNIYIYILTSPENEFPLIFDRPSYVFDESGRRPVGQVQATDKDLPQRSLTYSISTGGASLQYPNIFWINPKMGELHLVTKVDYETTPIYILRIQATSNEDTSSVTVTVNILEENDEKPICIPNSYFLALLVDLKVGTNIQNFKLTCTDLDSSLRSFHYSTGPAQGHLPGPEEKRLLSIRVVRAFCHHFGLHISSGSPGVPGRPIGQRHPQTLPLQDWEEQGTSVSCQWAGPSSPPP